MRKNTIPLSDTGLFNNVIIDYVHEKESLSEFVDNFSNPNSIEKKIKSLDFKNRKVLTSVLKSQYEKTIFSNIDKKKIFRKIEILNRKNTYTICSGHQLNIFLSPLFLIYKIIGLISYKEYLNKKFPNFECVPIFWLASEDHDFDEIKKIRSNNNEYSWNIDNKSAVGNLSTGTLVDILNSIKNDLCKNKYGEDLYEIFENAYTKNNDLSSATSSIIGSLFSNHEIIVLDANERELKRLFVSHLKKEILENEIYKCVSDTNKKLVSKKYKPQINALKFNIFYMTNGLRAKIKFNESYFYSESHNKRWTKNEIISEIDKYPERFSPNVFFRTLYQQYILPNVLYIGGPSEICYWLQLRSSFRSFGIPFPILQLRPFYLLVSQKSSQFYKNFNLSESDFFKPKNFKFRKIIHKTSQFDFDKLESDKKFFLKQIENQTSNTKNFNSQSLDSFKKKLENEINKFKIKIIRTEKNNNMDLEKKIESVDSYHFIDNLIQEKSHSFFYYFIKYGPSFFDLILKQNLVFDNKYIILKETE